MKIKFLSNNLKQMLNNILASVIAAVVTALVTGFATVAFFTGKFSNRMNVCESRILKNEEDIENLEHKNTDIEVKLAEIQVELKNIAKSQTEIFTLLTTTFSKK